PACWYWTVGGPQKVAGVSEEPVRATAPARRAWSSDRTSASARYRVPARPQFLAPEGVVRPGAPRPDGTSVAFADSRDPFVFFRRSPPGALSPVPGADRK